MCNVSSPSHVFLTMNEWHLFTAWLLLASISVGLIRVLVKGDRVERLLALQLLGTTAVAVVLLLAHALHRPGMIDLAMVIGLLAAVVAVAFVRLGGFGDDDGGKS